MIDETHDATRRSWVAGADGHADFPLQNLPLGVFSCGADGPRGGMAIGDDILDLAELAGAGILDAGTAGLARTAAAPALNAFLALGPAARGALRRAVFNLLAVDGAGSQAARQMSTRLLKPARACTMHLPVSIGDYTDFYAGIHHATNAGAQFRPNEPLLGNYKHVPIAYHGRSSSIQVDGAAVRRPAGQLPVSGARAPVHAATDQLDFEAELGVVIGTGNPMGEPIPIRAAREHVGGYCLLNDWSARDIQAWEYRPLGPFTAKNFATTISPWIVSPEALAPFRRQAFRRGAGDPAPLAYLDDEEDRSSGGLDCEVTIGLQTAAMRGSGTPPVTISTTNTAYLYWTVAQMVAHHTVSGCNLRSGDLLGTGTISGPAPDSVGSLMEMTHGGREPIALPSGESRRFLEDGDLVILSARCIREGFSSIGFGACRGMIASAASRRPGIPGR